MVAAAVAVARLGLTAHEKIHHNKKAMMHKPA
jgi:hypothetical protein